MPNVRVRRYGAALLLALLVLTSVTAGVAQTQGEVDTVTLELTVPAVAQSDDGLVGVPGTLRVTMQSPGDGRVFVSARPLTDMDMQASARLAVGAASSVSGIDASDRDFFFSVETSASSIGGPSAGGAMAVAAAALLMGLPVRDDVAMTGMINPDASIGPVGGILQKTDAAAQAGADTFVVPLGQTTVVVTETRTVEDPQGGTSTQTVQRSVDVAQYAQENHGIKVVEAADLYQAVAPFTGRELVRPVPETDPLQDPAYREATAGLSADLRTEAEAVHADLTARADAQRGNMTPNDAQTVDTELGDATDRIVAADASADADEHYLAASHAFRALVALEHAAAILGFYEQEQDADAYVASYIQETQALVAEATDEAKAERPVPLGRLDAQGAAEIRALEADSLADAAGSSNDAGDLGDAVRAASFARQRAASVDWWLEIGQRVGNGTQEVSPGAVDAVLADYAETVQLDLQYAQLIVGSESAQLQAALAAQQRARQAVAADMPYAALFGLVEAVATANAALVALAGDETVGQRLAEVEASAAYEIQLAASLGASPLYATSLVELAGETRQSDPAGSYALYSSARLAARTVLLAAGVDLPAAQVSPVDGAQSWVVLLLTPTGQQVAVAVVGAVAGLATGIVLAVRGRDRG